MAALYLRPGGLEARAELRDKDGKTVGQARFVQQDGGVRTIVQVSGVPPGRHGIHIHAVGKCDAPDFTTAGGHFNPFNGKHRLENADGPHAGDLPNLDVSQDGRGSLDFTNQLLTLKSGASSTLFDSDGNALIIHANMDDQKTDPAGNSGGRVACGIITQK